MNITKVNSKIANKRLVWIKDFLEWKTEKIVKIQTFNVKTDKNLNARLLKISKIKYKTIFSINDFTVFVKSYCIAIWFSFFVLIKTYYIWLCKFCYFGLSKDQKINNIFNFFWGGPYICNTLLDLKSFFFQIFFNHKTCKVSKKSFCYYL